VIAKLDRYIAFYHRVLAQANSKGERIPSWPTAYVNVWAKKKDSASTRRGTKIVIADQFTLLQYTEFTIRFLPELVATDRLVDDLNLSYEIIQIGEIGRREGQLLLCKAVNP
jgi:hypothetical protein